MAVLREAYGRTGSARLAEPCSKGRSSSQLSQGSMFGRFLVAIAFAFALNTAASIASPSPTVVAVAGAPVAMFPTEAAAQKHCPKDEVVWLNIPTGVYHEKGMRWYARTKRGAYVCRKEADVAGDRDTRNGQ